MTQTAPRQFAVHARHDHSRRARTLTESSFEAAAMAYLEDFPLRADDAAQISVVVRDVESGFEHCFRIDLDTGDTRPCG